MNETMRKNERCFIGMPSCGYGYESAKLCFVACPSDAEYTLKIDAIKDIVESKQYECHIALKKIDPGNFAFCTKICSKIIQSQFCVVLLDPSTSAAGKGAKHPNPNVHFEYGMMVSQNKHIIPLQDERSSLSFNVFPLDTIKYNDTNFKSKVVEAIDNAIQKFSERKVPGQMMPGSEITTFYDLEGYDMSDIMTVDFNRFLFGLGGHLGFFLYQCGDKYKYVGPFDYEDPKKVILHTKLLMRKVTSAHEALLSSKADDAQKDTLNHLINNISIDIIVPPSFGKQDILGRIKEVSGKEQEYPISVYYRTDIRNRIEDEYRKIGDIDPIRTAKA